VLALTAAALLATALPAAGAPSDTTDFLFGRDDLSDLAKDFDEGRNATDANLAKWLEPGQRVTAILMRVKKENGKVAEIEVWYSTRKHLKAERVRERPFTPADKDFKRLMKSMSLTE
jgi:hypothetical protein